MGESVFLCKKEIKMDCKEFREKISAGEDFNKELIEHKEECIDCQEWLKKELSTAPAGVNKEDWDKAVSKCLPSNDNKDSQTNKDDKLEKPDEDENKSFMDYYLSGLKYGIVFGLSIVVGFAIIQNKNESNTNQNSANKPANIASESLNIASDSSDISIATDNIILPMPDIK